MMEELETPKSSQIQRIVFDQGEGQEVGALVVKFRKGGLWQYEAVPRGIFDQFKEIEKAGSSVGSFFSTRVKGVYRETKLG